MNEQRSWRETLDERDVKEIELCEYYTERLGHGTTGHNRMALIVRLARMLDELGQAVVVEDLGECPK